MWAIFAFLSSITAASVAILAKIGLKNIDTLTATALRSVIMTLFLLLVWLISKKNYIFSWESLTSKDWMFLVLAGIAGALSWLFYFLALQTGLATKVMAIDRLSIVFVVIFAAIFLGEGITWKTAIGALIMVVGALIISAEAFVG